MVYDFTRSSKNTQAISLAFGFITVTNATFELGICNLVRKYIMNTHITYSILYVSYYLGAQSWRLFETFSWCALNFRYTEHEIKQ
jgi:hypothetical protein